jgi:hypothetical protein
MREAIARSLRDVVPAKNAMPLDAALEWSRRDWEREEAEQQRRLLDLTAAQCRAAAAVQPSRARRSSSWRSPATTTSTGLRRHVSATLGRGRAARHCHRRTAATLATTAGTTRRSTAD